MQYKSFLHLGQTLRNAIKPSKRLVCIDNLPGSRNPRQALKKLT